MGFSEWFYEKAEDISNEDRYYFDSFKNDFSEAYKEGYKEGYKEALMMIQAKFSIQKDELLATITMLQDELEKLKK